MLERDPSYREASSALSASSIRQQFSTPVNIAIGLFGIGFLRAVGDDAGRGDERPEIGLVEPGYLYLATRRRDGDPAREPCAPGGARRRCRAADARGAAAGAIRGSTVDDLAGASHGRTGEGWFDGYGLLRAFRAKADRPRGPLRLRPRPWACPWPVTAVDRGLARATDQPCRRRRRQRRRPLGRRRSPPWPGSSCRYGRRGPLGVRAGEPGRPAGLPPGDRPVRLLGPPGGPALHHRRPAACGRGSRRTAARARPLRCSRR